VQKIIVNTHEQSDQVNYHLSGDLLPGVSRAIEAYLELHGVRVRTGRAVAQLVGDADEEQVTAVRLDDDEVIPADVLVEAIGSHPNTEWLTGNGLDLTDGVICDEHLGVEQLDAVVAVGDVARFPNRRYDDVPRRVEHWSMPTDTAKHAAGTLARRLTGAEDDRPPFAPLPSFWSDQLELRIQSFGLPALADSTYVVKGVVEPDRLTDGLVVHYLRAGALVAVVLVNPAAADMREQRRLVDEETAAQV
jgi:NADPH-dependent 2,4-dienoyl-CoA reductase/sulfur reductase-like enzyme